MVYNTRWSLSSMDDITCRRRFAPRSHVATVFDVTTGLMQNECHHRVWCKMSPPVSVLNPTSKQFFRIGSIQTTNTTNDWKYTDHYTAKSEPDYKRSC
eukprot:3236029-Prymnesium_polylepis.1